MAAADLSHRYIADGSCPTRRSTSWTRRPAEDAWRSTAAPIDQVSGVASSRSRSSAQEGERRGVQAAPGRRRARDRRAPRAAPTPCARSGCARRSASRSASCRSRARRSAAAAARRDLGARKSATARSPTSSENRRATEALAEVQAGRSYLKEEVDPEDIAEVVALDRHPRRRRSGGRGGEAAPDGGRPPPARGRPGRGGRAPSRTPSGAAARASATPTGPSARSSSSARPGSARPSWPGRSPSSSSTTSGR